MAEDENIETILEFEETVDRPDPRDFCDVYEKEEVKKDLQELKLKKKKIKKKEEGMAEDEKRVKRKNDKRGRAFETLFSEQSHEGEWFGSEAMVSRTSEYDDVMNGIDLMVEIPKEETKRLALAVDASVSSDEEVIREKVTRNIRKIGNRKKSPQVKYFEPQVFGENKGKVEGLLPVVVGAERKHANKLFDLFAELKKLEKVDGSKERKQSLRQELASHPLHCVFLEEIKIQLEAYKKIFERNFDKRKECEELLSVINGVIEEKKESEIFSEGMFEDDLTYRNIIKACEESEKKEGVA